MTADEIPGKARLLFDAKRLARRQAVLGSARVDPPGMATIGGKLTEEWVAWINRAALEAVAADEGVAVNELVDSMADDPVAWKFDNLPHQDLAERLCQLNPALHGRLVQAKVLVPFVVWLVHQREEREEELRCANETGARSQAALEVYGPFLPGGDADEDDAAWFRELEEDAEQDGLEMLARWSQQDIGKDQDTLDDEEDERIADLRRNALGDSRAGRL